jgi:thioredoxin 1
MNCYIASLFAFFLCVSLAVAQPVAPKPTYAVIQFSATWCGPCRQLTPIMESKDVQDAMSKKSVDFYHIDVDKHSEYSKIYRVGTIPCVVLVKVEPQGTTELKRFIGLKSKQQVVEWLR